MNVIGCTLRFLLFLVNAGVGVGFLICAYSPYLSPVSHPLWACTGLLFPVFLSLNFLFFLFWLLWKRNYVWLPLLVFVAGWGAVRNYIPVNIACESETETPIKLLTYNTWGMKTETDENGNKTNPVLNYLKGCGADIVCLQEYPVNDKKIHKELVSVYPYIKSYSIAKGLGVACLSKYPILESELIRFPSAYNCSALFRLKMQDDTLAVVCNHLESNKLSSEDRKKYKELLKSPSEQQLTTSGRYLLRKYAEAVAVRAVQADSVAQVIKNNRSHYMVVCGDFNDSPISYAHRVISKGLKDAYVEAGCGPGFSYNRNYFYFRIDHILTSDAFRVLDCRVDRSIRASDHYPVWCMLEKR